MTSELARIQLQKHASLAETLMQIALPMAHSPGTQAALMGTAKALIHGRQVKGVAVRQAKKIMKKMGPLALKKGPKLK